MTRLSLFAFAGVVVLGAGMFFGRSLMSVEGVTRLYYVAADEVDWDYLPAGRNLLTDEPLTGEFYRVRGIEDTVLATVFRKAVYHEYTDSTFTELKPRPTKWEHLGILGPVLRGTVGDEIVVVFRNNTKFPVSMHPHGVFYKKDSEGAPYIDGTEGAMKHDDGVPPGENHTYVWPVLERAGPGPGDPNSIIWPYHSHTMELEDVHGGLIGPIIITRAGQARADGTPKDVDREFVTMFGVLDENTTRYTPDNRLTYAGDTASVNADGAPVGFYRFGYHSINGFLYSNMPVSALSMVEDERVRWYLFSSTGFNDFHTPHWHGGTLLFDQRRVDVVDLGGPLLMLTADMVADNPGIWLFHCHFADHMVEGMSTRFEITPLVASR